MKQYWKILAAFFLVAMLLAWSAWTEWGKRLSFTTFDLTPMIEELLDKTSDLENETEYFQWKKGGLKEILIAEMINYDTAGNYDIEKGIYKHNRLIGKD
ncbi:MAG: hypothetical protein JRI72_15380 [Deltaproteobacteria bacterium]|nr:hypothetical protein [Deltaproteobacteria bacterium]